MQNCKKKQQKKDKKVKQQNAKLRNTSMVDKLIKNAMNKVDVKIVTNRKKNFKWSF